jgi:hypothetical protein
VQPVLPAWADCQAMDTAAQRRFNRDRSRYHSALVLAWTPPVLPPADEQTIQLTLERGFESDRLTDARWACPAVAGGFRR